MKLDKNINYIVSGLERSGTSMLMQILKAGNVPISFDKSRKPDDNNPKGYFELEGGKIINKLIEGDFPLDQFKGEFIKITSYGLKYLPEGQYKIIYSERDIDEIMDSMNKMAGDKNNNPSEIKKSFLKLNKMIKNLIINRNDIDVLFLSYNDFVKYPKKNIYKIGRFLKIKDLDIEEMNKVIDPSLYRHRKSSIF